MNDPIEIQSTDFWVKVVGMLQQNWALNRGRGEGSRPHLFHQ